MLNLINKLVKGALLTSVVGMANASIIYDGNVTPSVKSGSGNGNGYFVIDRENDIEVGLRAKIPYSGIYNSQGNGIYSMPTGSHPTWGPPGAAWNYEFSINVDLDGSGSGTFSDFNTLLSIDLDPGLGQSWLTFDPVTVFTDNYIGNDSLAQNSMNIGWIPGVAIDTNIAATYDFKLGVYDLSGSKLAETFMTVEVDGGAAAVPEPAPALVFGLGLMGLAGARVKRKKA